jgi:hypothetical protein
LGDLPARTSCFFGAGFFARLAFFLAGFDGLACAFTVFGRDDFFADRLDLAGAFELFFFGELAIFSESPLVCRARAEAYLRSFPAGRKERFPR